MFAFTQLPPLSLYIHLPWCVSKCPYCDFNSHALRAEIPQQAYIDALLRDLEQDLPRVWGRSVQTLFIGGGTPSLFAPASIERLLCGVRARIPVNPHAEITLEANPSSAELAHFHGYRAAGVNRLSIGVQSFDAEKLRALGRAHGRAEALAAAAAARAADFDNFNLDLMFGLPAQTQAQALADITQALALQPTHLSLYQLTLEPNTHFHRYPPTLPDDDETAEMQAALQAVLATAGYTQYEVSAYAQAPYRCRHNLNYWQFGDYLGIGAGAHAKITDAHGVTRLVKTRQPNAYLASAGTAASIAHTEAVACADVAFEFMLNALRLTAGVPLALFSAHTGLPLATIQAARAEAEAQGLLQTDAARLLPSARGRQFLNDLIALFLPPSTRAGHVAVAP